MKRFIWCIGYVWWLRALTNDQVSYKVAWDMATDCDYWHELTPREAVRDELSYWTND